MELHEHPKFLKAIAIEKRIKDAFGKRFYDPLMIYRKWLDRNDIPAETDGWPSDIAMKDETVEQFIKEVNSDES